MCQLLNKDVWLMVLGKQGVLMKFDRERRKGGGVGGGKGRGSGKGEWESKGGTKMLHLAILQ